MNKRGNIALPVSLLVLGFIASIVLFIIATTDLLKVVSVVLFVLSLVFTIVFFIVHVSLARHSVTAKLDSLDELLATETIEVLKSKYMEIYNQYLKISAGKKEHVYERVVKARESIEVILKATKKLDNLLESVQKLKPAQKKKVLDRITEFNKNLPTKEQEKFHSRIMQAKDTGKV